MVNNPASPGNVALARASEPDITAIEGGGAVTVTFPFNVSGCANVAGRNNAGTSVPNSGYAQTNSSAANPNAIEVRTQDKDGNNEDADFHLIVDLPLGARSGAKARRVAMSTRSPRNGTPSARSRARCRSPLASEPSARTTRHQGRSGSSAWKRTVPANRGAPGETSP